MSVSSHSIFTRAVDEIDRVEVAHRTPLSEQTLSATLVNQEFTPVDGAVAFLLAQAALDTKATAIGAGVRIGDIAGVPGGFVAHYDGVDVYVGTDRVAHEVHGDIRAKYDALGGAGGTLGLPVTDETGTPDGIGRFNHFVHGSIYWTPRTGPMSVLGTVRDRWAASGWERGPLGYPVRDQHRMALLGPTPLIEWCIFENGAIASDVNGALPTPARLQTPAELHGVTPKPALLTYAQLGDLFGRRFNDQFKASPDNVALRAGVELTGVTPWTFDFWASHPRTVGFALRGFHDNGLAPDTDFRIDIAVSLDLVWAGQGFTEPLHKTLVAELAFLRVITDGGLPLGAVIDGVRSAISDSFQSPDPAHPEIPRGGVFLADIDTGADLHTGAIDVLDVQVTAAGDLQVLVNPLSPQPKVDDLSWVALRQTFAQDRLDAIANP